MRVSNLRKKNEGLNQEDRRMIHLHVLEARLWACGVLLMQEMLFADGDCGVAYHLVLRSMIEAAGVANILQT